MTGREAWRTWPIPAKPTTLKAWQQGRCAYCGDEARLVEDHCHRTGLIRGLLCKGCNVREGVMAANEPWDDTKEMRSAVLAIDLSWLWSPLGSDPK